MHAINIEDEIKQAVAHGILIDQREIMPRGVNKLGQIKQWPKRSPDQILGVCIHQSAGSHRATPLDTALYHTRKGNHIMHDGSPLPTIVYPIAIPDAACPAILCGDILDRTYAQNADDTQYPGDENTHLLAIVVLGDFDAPGYRGQHEDPTTQQMQKLTCVLDWAQAVFEIPNQGIFGHYHFGKACCPGFLISAVIETRRSRGQRLITVEQWQSAINAIYPGKLAVDGIWGKVSQAALTQFQKDHDMRKTGVRDPFTELKLMSLIHSVPPG